MAPEIKIHVVELANRVDLDVTAPDEPPHLDLHYLPMSLKSQYDIGICDYFLARLNKVQEELLHYPQCRRLQNVKVFTFKFFMWWARR